jgi:hypothetical protein
LRGSLMIRTLRSTLTWIHSTSSRTKWLLLQLLNLCKLSSSKCCSSPYPSQSCHQWLRSQSFNRQSAREAPFWIKFKK